MLKFEFDGKEKISIDFAGNLIDAITETTFMVNVIYERIKATNSASGKMFKDSIMKAFEDGIIFMDDDDENVSAQEIKDILKSLKRSQKND